MSTMYSGKVIDGRVVIEDSELPEGAEVLVILRHEEEVVLDPEEEAELEAAIDDFDAHPEDHLSGEELLRRLRRGE